MKKSFLAAAIILAVTLAVAGVAWASGGPHGGFTATTDACAGCHRAHTAPNRRLLVRDSVELCTSCHGSSATGANTNVEDGVYLSDRDDDQADQDVGAPDTGENAPLLGGGFVEYEGEAVTSVHDVDPAMASDAAWGNGVDRGVTAPLADIGDLTCSACHDPHGSDVYRILREEINGVTVTAEQVDEDFATCDPVDNPDDCNKDYDQEHWGEGMNSICAACHGAYHTTAGGVGSDDDELDNGGYTHRVGMSWDGDDETAGYIGMGELNPELDGYDGYNLPLAETDEANNEGTVVCMTCHLPHGTSAAEDGFAAGDAEPDGPLGPIPSGDSALLRLDNRGVCQVCHQK